MFGSLGFTELVLILFIVLIIFGAGKLPQLGEGVGKAIKGFKKSVEVDPLEADVQHSVSSTQTAPVNEPVAEASMPAHQPEPVSVSKG
ncbi:MAG: twin-arginine translocase TatA/TatE family subunit [Nitrospirales bacterium]|nr:twin-arginine translocase TatA/TatE family subunit [Nitrospirales bacterium]